ncbi:uncharacterized protein PSANT_01446 [Moesziomyces antarcticus]|uniref:Uncharacterized protein n=1 Tax=Pseudozyma antarctica TaxID=84753 RepID=A0A5C3FJR0_PSEA2|nr:uncharacterized protein PSANT_01446 [Moesziomyces antarcticus]
MSATTAGWWQGQRRVPPKNRLLMVPHDASAALNAELRPNAVPIYSGTWRRYRRSGPTKVMPPAHEAAKKHARQASHKQSDAVVAAYRTMAGARQIHVDTDERRILHCSVRYKRHCQLRIGGATAAEALSKDTMVEAVDTAAGGGGR